MKLLEKIWHGKEHGEKRRKESTSERERREEKEKEEDKEQIRKSSIVPEIDPTTKEAVMP